MTADQTSALALIPARGGSKGVPNKNLRLIGGVSLTAHAIRCARETGLFDRIVVTTDSDPIAAEAVREEAEIIRRPPELASDTADVVNAVEHALDILASQGFSPAIVVLLEPTSPLRTPVMVNRVLKALGSADAAFTVSPVPLRFHPAKQFTVNQSGEAAPACPDVPPPVQRQDLQATYIRNGAVYAFRPLLLRAHRSVLGPAPKAILLDEVLVNIDTEEDLLEAERLYRQMANRK